MTVRKLAAVPSSWRDREGEYVASVADSIGVLLDAIDDVHDWAERHDRQAFAGELRSLAAHARSERNDLNSRSNELRVANL